jgi:alkylation response protein AidB-like acyl-CoA dehydrogenase
MDLAFTPEEQKFREDIRAWVQDNLPKDISHKVHNALHLTATTCSAGRKILGKKGWLGHGWPKSSAARAGTPCKSTCLKKSARWPARRASCPSARSWWRPVIMAFGSPEQQNAFCPASPAARSGGARATASRDRARTWRRSRPAPSASGDKYIVNGQKTWTTLGQYGEWIFCLVRTSTEGKPQTGISFLLLDMKSPGVTVRPVIMLDGGHEVNEVWFDNVEVPAENLIGEENKGWTYAKHLLSHERTNIADVNRAKRELERLKRIAKTEGVYDDTRFRDEIAKLEVDVVALEMLVLRVLSAEKSGKNSLDIAGLLKIRGSEIQQRYSELMMLAAGPYSLPFIQEAMEAGWQGDAAAGALGGFPGGVVANAPLASTYLQHAQDHHLRRQQRSAAQHRVPGRSGLRRHQHGFRFF